MEALGINLPGLVTQIVSFLLLFLILWRLLYKPILTMLDERSTKIKESLETANRVKEDAARSRKAMSHEIEKARAEGQEMMLQAREVASKFREQELSKARQDIETERNKAQENIQRERDAAIEELRGEFAELAIKAAEKVVGKSLNESIHRDLIEDVLARSSNIKQD